MTKVLALLPAYNEEARIREVVGRVRERCGDVLVVDDGSRDGTAREAAAAGAAVLRLPFNQGYGAALQTGYKYAVRGGYEFVVQLDADGQHDPEFLDAVLEPVRAGEADLCIGSRFLHGGYDADFARGLGMGLFRAIASRIVGRRLTDVTSGYQAMNRRAFSLFATDVFPCDYPDADVVIMAHFAGLRVCEVPVRMHARSAGRSMHSGLKPVYYVFKMLLSIFVTLLRERPRLPADGANPGEP